MKHAIRMTMLALALLPAFALAGYTQPAPVVINVDASGAGSASGDMVSARFAPNDVEVIGCGARIYDYGASGYFHYGYCQARDEKGTQAFCWTERADLLDVLKGISDFSYVTFNWNDAGECTMIGVSTNSFYMPAVLGS